MICLIPSLPAIYVITRVVWPLSWPLALKMVVSVLLLAASQYHQWSRVSSGSVFAPEFPRPIVMLFNVAFGSIALLAAMQIVSDIVVLASMALPGGGGVPACLALRGGLRDDPARCTRRSAGRARATA